jgi:hypothetical protein
MSSPSLFDLFTIYTFASFAMIFWGVLPIALRKKKSVRMQILTCLDEYANLM